MSKKKKKKEKIGKKEKILRENRKPSAFSSLALVWVGRCALRIGVVNLQFCFLPPGNTVTKRDEIRAQAEMHFFWRKEDTDTEFHCFC